EHTLPIVRKHGLLKVTVSPKQELLLDSSQYTGKHTALTEFTPYHAHEEHTAKHALIPSSIIQDKNARRLYLAIDGRKSIGELASVMQLTTQEFYAALSLLLAQKRVQILGTKELVNGSSQSLKSAFV